MPRFWRSGRVMLPLVAVFLTAASSFALTSDEIALVVNANVPEGRALAELYARERHVPDGRIIAIDLDPGRPSNPAEEMPFGDYEVKVAAPVRAFLTDNKLTDRVKCLVTFWGVPLRIGARRLTQPEKDEAAQLARELADLRQTVAQGVVSVEQSAAQLDPSFKPLEGEDLPHLARRLDAAMPAIVKALPAIKDPAGRAARYSQLVSASGRLLGTDRTTQLMSQPAVALFAPDPPTRDAVSAAQARVADVERQVAAWESETSMPADREKARALARDNLGLFGYAYLARAQLEWLNAEQTESALDSELSLLWWRGYPRAKWVPNPLEWRTQNAWRRRPGRVPVTLMVTRLDGPSIPVVRNLIETSARVEGEGLKGQVAIDARGKTGTDPYAEYDDRLRRLADLLRTKSKLQVTLDNNEALIPEHSLKDIAVYCGWYSLRNYVPPGSFSAGAVGFHVASFEMVSLRGRREHGWVRGLLSDGVVGTVGPVAEPYLQSFPPADEFFPLLFTGRLTLAEVYWRTVPWSSWMQTCIGDPLYNPYHRDPPLAVEDLPGELRSALGEDATTLPATQPVSIK